MKIKEQLIKIMKPEIPADLLITPAIEGDYYFEDGISGLKTKGGDLSGLFLHKLVIEKCELTNLKWIGTKLGDSDITDVIFENCDFSNADLQGASIHRTVFKNCRLTGTNFNEVYLKNVKFENCKADYIRLMNSKISLVVFSDCYLVQGDFKDIEWSKTVIQGCNLKSSEFHHTKLAGMDFSSCEIDGLRAGVEDLKGLILESYQLGTIAGLMGIIVK